MEYIASLLWGLVVMFSFFGWGAGFVRVVGDFEERPSKYLSEYFAYKATLGMALLVVLGGVLNLLGVISPVLCVVIVVGGAGWAVWEIFCYYKNPPKRAKKPKEEKYQQLKLFITTVLWTLVAVVALAHYLGSAWSVIGYNINILDDMQAYMVFPQKMLQNGELGADPFSGRRLESSLGGQYFLHTLFLAVLENESLDLLDGGIALILMALMAYGICNRLGIPVIYTLVFILTILFLDYQNCNTSSIRTSYLITLCVFDIFLRTQFSKAKILGRVTAISVLLAAACALKGTNIAAMGLFLASYYIIIFLSDRKRKLLILQEAALLGIVTVLCLLPWMLALYKSSGTFLYPLLGVGYSKYNYYKEFYFLSSDKMSLSFILTSVKENLWCLYLPVVLSLVLVTRTKERLQKEEYFTVAAIFISAVGMNIAFCWIDRYYQSTTYPAMFIIVFWGLGTFFSDKRKEGFAKNYYQIMSVLLALVLFYIAAYNMALLMQRAERAHGSIRNILEQIKLDDQQTISRYQALLNDIPEDSIILVMLDRPYLLDFTKHEIWLNDWPGASSLPPGLPFNKKDGEALSSYLLSKNIRYIAYSYEDQAVFRDRFKVWLVPPDEMPLWAVNEKHNYDFRDTIKRVYDFQDTVMSLSRKRLRVYDDSRIFILDLATVVSTKEEL